MSLQITALDLPGVVEIVPERFFDARGYFCETWNSEDLRRHGIDQPFMQDNQSFSIARGVLRGLHYQTPPFAQAKLVRVTRGAIFDVAVDIRPGSPQFGQWVGLEVSAKSCNQILIPAGFAHGFVTLEPETEVIYKVTRPYSRAHERAIRFDDPDIAIAWPVQADDIQLSSKDAAAPFLAEALANMEVPA